MMKIGDKVVFTVPTATGYMSVTRTIQSISCHRPVVTYGGRSGYVVTDDSIIDVLEA